VGNLSFKVYNVVKKFRKRFLKKKKGDGKVLDFIELCRITKELPRVQYFVCLRLLECSSACCRTRNPLKRVKSCFESTYFLSKNKTSTHFQPDFFSFPKNHFFEAKKS